MVFALGLSWSFRFDFLSLFFYFIVIICIDIELAYTTIMVPVGTILRIINYTCLHCHHPISADEFKSCSARLHPTAAGVRW